MFLGTTFSHSLAFSPSQCSLFHWCTGKHSYSLSALFGLFYQHLVVRNVHSVLTWVNGPEHFVELFSLSVVDFYPDVCATEWFTWCAIHAGQIYLFSSNDILWFWIIIIIILFIMIMNVFNLHFIWMQSCIILIY